MDLVTCVPLCGQATNDMFRNNFSSHWSGLISRSTAGYSNRVRRWGTEVGGLVKIDFVGRDKWDTPSCIKLPYDALLGSCPESLRCGPVCWSRPCDGQLTTNIKHLKTELGLDWSQPGAASQLHSSQLQREADQRFDSSGKPIPARLNVEVWPKNC